MSSRDFLDTETENLFLADVKTEPEDEVSFQNRHGDVELDVEDFSVSKCEWVEQNVKKIDLDEIHGVDTSDENPGVDASNLKRAHNRHKCRFCEASFNFSRSLVTHENTHFEVKSSCEVKTGVETKSSDRPKAKNKRSEGKNKERPLLAEERRKRVERRGRKKAQAKKEGREVVGDPQIKAQAKKEGEEAEGDSKKKFRCRFCEYSCSDKSYLLAHERAHTGEKPYSCESCGYKTNRKDVLNIHIKIHLNKESEAVANTKKKFQCKFCEYRCSSKSYLRAHERAHTGEKPYSCELCGYKANRKDTLNIHIKTHEIKIKTNENDTRSFICMYCTKQCKDARRLTIHERTHTGEKPLSCDFCDFTTAWPSSLDMHKKLKHKNDMEEFAKWAQENANMDLAAPSPPSEGVTT